MLNEALASTKAEEAPLDPKVLIAAKSRLDGFGGEPNFTTVELIGIINNTSIDVRLAADARLAAIYFLVKRNEIHASLFLPVLCGLLDDSSVIIRVDASWLLRRMGVAARPACPSLFRRVKQLSRPTERRPRPLGLNSAARAALVPRTEEYAENEYYAFAYALSNILCGKSLDIEFNKYDHYDSLIESLEQQGLLLEPEKEPPQPPTHADELSRHLDTLLATVPQEENFAELSQQLGGLSHEFRRKVAARLEPALNACIQAMPQETREQKDAICNFLEKTLEPLGLAVKAPNTPGLPGKLKTHPGSWPKLGRFMFEAYIDGKRKQPAFSDTLPELELTDATPAIKPETPWQDIVGPKSYRRDRKLT